MANRSLQQRFDPRRNSLNALRLGLAVLVIVSHSWPVGGYGPDPGIGSQDLGDWAVAGFFATSGYLIISSRLNSRSLIDFLWRRLLRIYPAFLVVLVVVGFVIAPLASAFLGAGPYSPAAAGSYVLGNLLLWINAYGIDGMLASVPFPSSWNGPIWTLFYEFACYIVIGVLVTVAPRRFVRVSVVVLFLACTVGIALIAASILSVPLPVNKMIGLAAYFLAGSLIYLFRAAIPIAPTLTVAAIGIIVVVAWTDTFRVLAGLPVGYLMLALGVYLPLQGVGSRNDISYGMYIYAFPVQQLLVLAFPEQQLPVAVFVLLAVLLTLPFAWASWLLVERTAMRLKRLTARAPVDVEGHVLR